MGSRLLLSQRRIIRLTVLTLYTDGILVTTASNNYQTATDFRLVCTKQTRTLFAQTAEKIMIDRYEGRCILFLIQVACIWCRVSRVYVVFICMLRVQDLVIPSNVTTGSCANQFKYDLTSTQALFSLCATYTEI